MQTFEFFALVFFLHAYLLQALRSIAYPVKYREAEIRFYKTGKPGLFEYTVWGFIAAALAALLAHFITEQPRIGQLLLYIQTLMFALSAPLNFIPFLRTRTKNTLNAKSASDYRSSGLRRLLIAAIMIILPLIVVK